MPTLRSARLSHGTVAWREAGAGPALIFLHGIGANAASWTAQLEHFSSRFRVIAWDAPGYGGSDDLPGEAPSAADYAAVLHQLVSELGLEKIRLVGQSLGALIAAAYARWHPLQALVLAAAASGYGQRPPAERSTLIAQRLTPLGKLGPAAFAADRAPRLLGTKPSAEALARVQGAMAQLRPIGYAQATRMLANADIFADAPRIRVPTLVICGDADVVTPPESNRAIADSIAAARFTRLPGLGHAAYVEDPPLFNGALDAFFATLPEPVS